MSAIICHFDMDAYFAAVEVRNNPHLRGKPVIVGGPPNSRGVVSTCSYEAREYGIHSAMPSAEAYRRCPHAVFVRGSFAAYTYTAEKLRELLAEFSPAVRPASIDEVVVDLSTVCSDFAEAELLAREMKAAIRSRLSLTASVGIGPNRLVAKIASAMQKPDGLTCIPADQVVERLSPEPVGCIWGIGPVTQQQLQRFGINTVADLFAAAQGKIISSIQEMLQRIAERLIETESDMEAEEGEHLEKSMSHSETLSVDIYEPEEVRALVLYLADKVVMRLQRKGAFSRTIGLRLRYKDWQTITRDRTLPRPIQDFPTVYETVCALLPLSQIHQRGIRLVGVRLSSLSQALPLLPPDLFEDLDSGRGDSLNDAIRAVRDKWGDKSLQRATSLIAPH
ncbi:MAG: DNA polymerase IV [bacterium]